MTHKLTTEGDGFQIEVKDAGEGLIQAKVRIEDEGQRGKNLVFTEYEADDLVAELDRLTTAASEAQRLVRELVTSEPAEAQLPPEPPPVPESPTL